LDRHPFQQEALSLYIQLGCFAVRRQCFNAVHWKDFIKKGDFSFLSKDAFLKSAKINKEQGNLQDLQKAILHLRIYTRLKKNWMLRIKSMPGKALATFAKK